MTALNIVVICVLVAVAAAQTTPLLEVYSVYNSSMLHIDNYINANSRQYAANIWSYDLQIQAFKDRYTERINTIKTQKDLLLDSLLQTDGTLYPYELLSDKSHACVNKYKSLIPPVSAVKFNMDKCMTTAMNQMSYLVQYPAATNTTLQNYYINTFDKTVQSCKRSYPTNVTSYSTCVENAVSAANIYTLSNQKTFATQLASSYSSGDVYVQTALECSYAELNQTISMISQATSWIDRCLKDEDTCNTYPQYYCDNIVYKSSSMISYYDRTMTNIFYGMAEPVKCTMIQVY